jgi:hypothetical protein
MFSRLCALTGEMIATCAFDPSPDSVTHVLQNNCRYLAVEKSLILRLYGMGYRGAKGKNLRPAIQVSQSDSAQRQAYAGN